MRGSQHDEVFDGACRWESNIVGSDAVSRSRKSLAQHLLSHSVQAALDLCKYNKVLSTQKHRRRRKTFSLPLPNPPFPCLPPPLSDPAAHLASEQRNK